MESLKIRQQIEQYIDQLPSEKLLVVADFLGYLVSKENHNATEELLNIDGIEESYQQAKDNISQRKVVNVRQLKRKY